MRKGRTVIAFYSDRSGVGQSMALASVAWLLATNGRRVLAIDWDLQKPSLLRYYMPFIPHDTLSTRHGVIDFVWEYALAARRVSMPYRNDPRGRIMEFTPCELVIPDDLSSNLVGYYILSRRGVKH
jgi:hypothetical protein